MLSPTVTVPASIMLKGGLIVFIFALPLVLFYAKRREWKECRRYSILGFMGLVVYFHEEIVSLIPHPFWSLT